MIINIAARKSKLSIEQVNEVLKLLLKHFPDISFKRWYLDTKGDMDKKKSLRDLGKSDFFTQEIDHFILNKKDHVGIHSAKDLPENILTGLQVVAFTKGLDSRDAIVTRNNSSFFCLKKNAIIATSSNRREEIVKELRSDLKFVDIRGTIEERLQILEQGQVDGVVIAEAAIQRLNLNLNRYIIDAKTVEGQGQLAILANKGDTFIESVFSKINYGLIT